MPSGPSCASAWPERLRRVVCLAACGILLCVPFISALANICVVVGAAVWLTLMCLPRSSNQTRCPPLVSGWAWFFLAGLLSFINTQYPVESLRGLLKMGKAFVIFAVAVEAGRSDEGPRWLARTAWIAVTMTALDGLWQYAAGQDVLRGLPLHIALGSIRRITAGFHDPNNLGMFFGLTLPLCYLYARSRSSSWRRPLVWAGVGLGALALFFTFSRGAVLGLLMGLALLYTMRPDRWLLILTLSGAGIAWLNLPHSIPQWLATTGSPVVALANHDRLQMWQAAWRMISAHPFIGVGVGTFSHRYAEFKLAEDPLLASYAHNTYLQLWAVIGLNGLLAFLALCWRGWRLWRSSQSADTTRRLVGLGCMAGVLAFLTHGLFESNLSFSKPSMLFWLMSGFAMGTATTPSQTPAKSRA